MPLGLQHDYELRPVDCLQKMPFCGPLAALFLKVVLTALGNKQEANTLLGWSLPLWASFRNAIRATSQRRN